MAAILLWVGWFLSPHHINEYVVQADFAAVGEQLWYWIWMFRVHIFGWVIMGVALFAFAYAAAKKPYGAILFSGAGVSIVGTFMIAIAMAFYYNYGAWGVGQTADKSPAEIQAFMDNILFTNQYVTCIQRFGRIFSGVGLIILGYTLVRWNIVHKMLGWLTVVLGLAAMMVILFIPDYYESYKPIFHIKVVWLLAMGIFILRKGINLSDSTS